MPVSVMHQNNMGWNGWGVKEEEEDMFHGSSGWKGNLLSEDQQSILDEALRNRNGNSTRTDETCEVARAAAPPETKKKGRGAQGGRGRGKRIETSLGERLPCKVLKGKVKKSSPLYSWGSRGTLSMDGIVTALDSKDPNYDSEGEDPLYYSDKVDETEVDVSKVWKQNAHDIMAEYFLSGDVDEVAIQLTSIDSPIMNAIFVKKAIQFSLDRGSKEKEMTSVLLSCLYGEVLSPKEIRRGFHDLLQSADDIVIDVPSGVDDISRFIARASVDDILPPSFVNELSKNIGDLESVAPNILLKSKLLLTAQHRADSLQRCWGLGAASELTDIKKAIDQMILEYLSSCDIDEACTCLRELRMPSFHHETIKRFIMTILESTEEDRKRVEDAVSRLFTTFCIQNLVSGTQMMKGFKRIADNIEDIKLDIPCAPQRFKELTALAMRMKWLDL